MCGFVGCKLRRPLNQADINMLRHMRKAIKYRGPDDEGEFFDVEQGLYLGHNRLAIIDLDSRSKQPMKRGNHVIAYNGEIYNYLELKEKLLGVADFQTTGDTEVLLEGWRYEGIRSLAPLDGMFAFALWNGHQLFLVTDWFGEKPLYYFENSEGLYFSSEPGSLIDALQISFEPDEQALSDFLYLGYVRAPKTGFKNLSVLSPASVLQLQSDGTKEISRYWDLPQETGHLPLSRSLIQETKDRLCISLQRRLRSDVPVGLFLSGGVDSSLCAALCKYELGIDLHTYTVSFPDGHDESVAASAIASHLKLSHTIIPSQNDDAGGIKILADLFGIPNDNMTALAIYQMCAAAKKNLTIAITGLGGDEIFYGYNRYEHFYKNRMFYWLANHAKFVLKGLSYILPGQQSSLIKDLSQGDRDWQFLRIKNGAAFDLYKKIIPPKGHFIEKFIPFFEATREFDIQNSLPQSFIPSVDRGSMRASVEVRTPFLNRDLYEFIRTLRQSDLIAGGKKFLARTILQEYLPLNLLTEGKQGFVYPAKRHISSDDILHSALAKLHQGFSRSVIEDICTDTSNAQNTLLMLRLSLLTYFTTHFHSHQKIAA
ncbi:MAG: asparagine synthase (glutamine-hydrolyzing) [Alphaproteobacteria bacterium]|nr:asparagine synthase (glutamine-hydrolyzing) [Alphaproteobacteria bacterium]